MKFLKNIYNRIFNRWTKWEVHESDMIYTKVTTNPILNYSFSTQVCVDIMKKRNKYTGMVKYKKVEKK